MTSIAQVQAPVNETHQDTDHPPWGFELLDVVFPATIAGDFERHRTREARKLDYEFVAQFQARKKAQGLRETLLFIRVDSAVGPQYRPLGRLDRLPQNSDYYYFTQGRGRKPVFVQVPDPNQEPKLSVKLGRFIHQFTQQTQHLAGSFLERLRTTPPQPVATPKRFKRFIIHERTHFIEVLPGEPCSGNLYRRFGVNRGIRYEEVA